MAKITLEFDAIEEAQEVQNAINGGKWRALVWDLDQKLRQTTKYSASAITESEEASEIDSDLFDEEIEEEEPAKDSAPTDIIEVKATEVDSTKLEDKKNE